MPETILDQTPEATPETTPKPEATPLFADPTNQVLAGDFANHMGDDVAPYAETLNQRFGNQPLATVLKSYGEANKTISQGGRVIGYPAHDSPAEMQEKWAAANGLHEKFEAADYKLHPEERPEGYDEAFTDAMAAKMLEHKTPPALAQALAKDFQALEAERNRVAQDMRDNAQHEALVQLKTTLGPEYDEKIAKAKAVAISQGFDPQNEMFNNPEVVLFLTKVSGLLGEDTIASMRQAAGASGQFTDSKTKAYDIMENPANPDYEKYQRGDATVAAKVNRLLSGQQ